MIFRQHICYKADKNQNVLKWLTSQAALRTTLHIFSVGAWVQFRSCRNFHIYIRAFTVKFPQMWTCCHIYATRCSSERSFGGASRQRVHRSADSGERERERGGWSRRSWTRSRSDWYSDRESVCRETFQQEERGEVRCERTSPFHQPKSKAGPVLWCSSGVCSL